MRLIYEQLETVLEWKETEVPIIVIENLAYRNQFIEDLFSQSNTNNDAPFYISDGSIENKQLKFETIINPFNLNVNQNNILNSLRKVYAGLIQEEYFELTALTSDISRYLNGIALSLPVNIQWEGGLNVKRLMQLFDLTVVDESTNLMERIMNYLQVNIQLGINELFIFINLKQFLDADELSELYEFLLYEEVKIILIENQVLKKHDYEKIFLIDDDLCVIY